MSSRYKNTKTKKAGDGRKVYRPKIYPNIPFRDDDMYVATELGDRLDTLSFEFYRDSTLWWIIASANNIRGANMAVEPGTILRIPKNFIQIISNFIQ
jgi:nucleoid-associated protein YgaU